MPFTDRPIDSYHYEGDGFLCVLSFIAAFFDWFAESLGMLFTVRGYQDSGVNRVSRAHGSFLRFSFPHWLTPGDSLLR